jgi:hypothetical protein
MEKLNKALLYALTKAVGKTDDEILNLVQTKNESGEPTLKDNADELLLNIITDKLKAVKGNPDEVWDKAWKKAQKETLEKAEKLLKETAGIDLDGETFDEKVSKFVDITNQKASKNKGAINDDDVKKHPLFLSLEQKATKFDEVLKEKETIKTEFDTFKNNITRESKINKVNSIIETEVEKLNLNLDKDPIRRKNQVKLISKEVVNIADDWEESENNFFAIKGGKRIENAQFTPKTVADLTKEISLQYFQPLAQTPKGAAGNETPPANYNVASMEDRNKQLKEVEVQFESGNISRAEADKKMIDINKSFKQ